MIFDLVIPHEHGNNLGYMLENINLNRVRNLNCDCIIQFGCQTKESHQIILKIASPVLEDLIEKSKENSHSQPLTINLNTILKSPENFPNILNFIYTGKITVTNENLFDLLELGTALKIEEIVKFCCRIVTDLLTLENVFGIYSLSSSLNRDLAGICQSFFCFEFYNLKSFFHQVSSEDFKNIISDKLLVLRNGETNYFFVGLKYLIELCRITGSFTGDKTLKEISHLNGLIELKMHLNKILSSQSLADFEMFISNKKFAVPNCATCPIGRYLPFGIHSIQYKNINQKTSLCSNMVFNTIESCSPNKWKIQVIIFYLIPKWNNLYKIVAGMDILYQKIWDNNETRLVKCQIDYSDKYQREELYLNSSENIVKIHINHSWVINSLTFETDEGHTFGPFGEPKPLQCPIQITSIDIRNHGHGILYLHGFHYVDIISGGWRMCNQLSLECAFISVKQIQNDYSNISSYVTKQIKSQNLTSRTEHENRNHANISILNMRPITFWNIENDI